MDCIYLNCKGELCYCHAQPIRPREVIYHYKPTDGELDQYCHKTDQFTTCPRFKAFQNYQRIVLVREE